MNPEKLKIIQDEIARLQGWIDRVFDAVMEEDISNYPILVFSDTDVEIGMSIQPSKQSSQFFLRISTLEEFSVKGMIASENVENFKSVYKDPSKFLCLFVIQNQAGSFVFHPRTA